MFDYSEGSGDFPITKFEEMLKSNAVAFFDAQEFESIIHHYIDYGQIQMAKRALQMAMDQHPKNTELLLLQSELLIFDNHYTAAQELLQKIEKLAPNNEEVLLQKASIHSKNNQHLEAIEMLSKALTLSDEPEDIWNLLGMEYLMLESYEEAQYFFEQCFEKIPEDYQSLYNLLYCYEQLEKDTAAIEILNRLLEKQPYSEIGWHQLGKIYYKQEKYLEALSAYDFAIISDDTFSGAYIEKGKVLEHLGRLNEAIEHYEIAMQLTEGNSYTHHRIGMCHQKLGNQALALRFFKEAVHLEPTNEKAWGALIQYYFESKNHSKALYYVEKALEVNADSVLLWKIKSQIHQMLGNFLESNLALQNVIDLGNYELENWMLLIDGYVQQGEFQTALKTSLQAREFYAENKAVALRLAAIYMKLGKIMEARYFKNDLPKKSQIPVEVFQLYPELEHLLAFEIKAS